jgi:O-antigen ligase
LLLRRVALGRLELGFLALLAAFTGWTALSALWSLSLPASVLEAQRAFVYVTAAAALLLLGRRESPPWLLGGVLAAAVAVALANLVLRDGEDPAAPVGYANGLAILLVLGIVLALGLAAARRERALRAAGALALVPLVAALAPLGSKGAWLALAVGVAAALVLRLARGPRAYPAVVVAGIVLAIGLAAAVSEQRRAYWRVGLEQVASAPGVGTGAGTYERVWLRERRAPLMVRDAHNLYLETLGELGPIGLALLASGLALPILAAAAARLPAAGGAYAAFVVHAGIDWDWELPAATVAGICCAGALLLAARGSPRTLSTRARTTAAVALAAVALAALVGLVGSTAVARGDDALADGRWDEAERRAGAVRRWAPWSDEGPRLLGEARRGQGRLPAAQRSFVRALDKDPGDPELWLALARVSTGPARARALAEALERNPLGGLP